MIRAISHQSAYTAPAPRNQQAEQPEGIGDCFEKALRWVAGKAVGIAFGTSGLVTNAAAGGARGIVHGARIENRQSLWFEGAMAANLAAAGAITGGPPGAALGLIGGQLIWRIQGQEVRERVTQRADEWVDYALAKLPGDPDQAGLPRRILNAGIGEAVGALGGAVAGSFAMFKKGEALGEELADRAMQRLRS